MKQILVMMAAVVLVVGCSKDTSALPQAAEAEPQVASKPTPVSPVNDKLIADAIVERAVGKTLNKIPSKLTGADLAKVTRLFIVSNTKITDAGLGEIAKLQNLTELNLASTQITDEGLEEVSKLQKLTQLCLDRTQITGLGLKKLAKLQNLTGLDLQESKITDARLKEVAKLQKLEILRLDFTKVTKAGVAELKKALPNCEITGP